MGLNWEIAHQGLEPEVIDDEQAHPSESTELSLVGAGGACGVEAGGELGAAREEHIDTLTDRAVAECLCEVALSDTHIADDEHGRVLGEVAAGGQIVNECAVEFGESIEIELIERLAGAEAGTAQARGELLLLASTSSRCPPPHVAPICRSASGSIMAITPWLHYADPALAPLCRSRSGSYKPIGDKQLPLNKVALIYAENARGETTLAAVLRSLGTGDPTPIVERKRLGSGHPPHVVINGPGNKSALVQNGGWQRRLGRVLVFDDNFVAENICSGIKVETDHRQKLHELITYYRSHHAVFPFHAPSIACQSRNLIGHETL